MEFDETNPWKKVKSKEIYSNDWIKLKEHKVLTPAKTDGIYGVVEFQNYAIGIIPLDENNNTWLVGQYRFPLNEYSWEIPMGGGLKTTNILDSAKRELLEETGIVAKQWTEHMKIHTSNCVTDETGFIFIAKNLSFQTAQPDETEKLEVLKVPFIKAVELVMTGQITDSISIAGILKLARELNL